MTKNKICKECRYWSPLPDQLNGHCKLYPPVTVVQGDKMYTAFPIVPENEWCGMWFDKDATHINDVFGLVE